MVNIIGRIRSIFGRRKDGFRPFPFMPPEPRPVYGPDGRQISELQPVVWYKAVARTPDGYQVKLANGELGLLRDTEGLRLEQ
ncbi:hypothetical protein ACFYNO_37775 [Kitasatospora sp. NPDC006697]|uniref:hypothetical protein n=1 Tax=Kitasatospora sp. NPDC006697 TaxID=3364020 RepID=UPI0036C0C93E